MIRKIFGKKNGCILTVDSHFKRVCRYARQSDYFAGLLTAAGGPGLMLLWERVAPSHVGKGGFASIMRLSGLVGMVGGFGLFYSRSIRRRAYDGDAQPER